MKIETYKEKILRIMKEKQIPRNPKEIQIENLKKELENDDYKIIKCIEYQLLNKELPYDIIELHNKRNVIREEINNMEKEKKEENI